MKINKLNKKIKYIILLILPSLIISGSLFLWNIIFYKINSIDEPNINVSELYSVEKMQKMLSVLGFYTGDIDGLNNIKTSEAIRNFQLFYGYEGKGSSDPALYQLLYNEYLKSSQDYNENDIMLLARLIEAEAGEGTWYEMISIGNTVLSRIENPAYPNTLAGVIFDLGAFKSVKNGKIWCIPSNKAISAAQDSLYGILK